MFHVKHFLIIDRKFYKNSNNRYFVFTNQLLSTSSDAYANLFIACEKFVIRLIYVNLIIW